MALLSRWVNRDFRLVITSLIAILGLLPVLFVPNPGAFVVDFAILFALYAILATSLNLEFGYTGLPNFGKMLAVAGGAFVAGYVPGRLAAWLFQVNPAFDYIADNSQVMAVVNTRLSSNPSLGIGLFLGTLLIAAVIGGILGFAASYPAIRLREDYLAITLLAMAEGLRIVGYNYPEIAGGTLGVGVADAFAWLTGNLSNFRYTILAAVFSGIALLVFLYAELLARSPVGRALRATRDNETAAMSLGKDVVKTRMKVLIIGSALAGIVGALFSFYTVSVNALSFDRVNWTFIPWVMVILGGAANNVGAVTGAFVFEYARKLIIQYKGSLFGVVPFEVVWLEYMLVGILLIIFLLYKPQGLIPEKPTFTLKAETLRQIVLRERARRPTAN